MTRATASVSRCCLIACLLLVAGVGCSRTHYRRSADGETFSILREKTDCSPWPLPSGYGLQPDPRSRLYDPTCIDDPLLPIPAPRLYAYELPELTPRGPNQYGEPTPAPPELARLPPVHEVWAKVDGVRLMTHVVPQEGGPPNLVPIPNATAQPPDGAGMGADAGPTANPDYTDDEGIIRVPIPPSDWEAVPDSCLRRMFEFERIREEYELTYGVQPPESARDTSRRLTLEDIVELTLLNSREYQTQKEVLYRTALRLSLERFDYALKFTPSGVSTQANFNHTRTGGRTVNGLQLPTTLQANRMLNTGGDLLARFANEVVLTFNGPNGFAADVSSQLLLNISQSIFQRDVTFEPLTQAERDVIYAARDFARFRKQLFFDVASRYYSLLLSYRNIEINTQNYFSLVRAFVQGEAEFRANFLSRVQLEQIEQNTLGGRSSLISTCNNLERNLDQLKLTNIGLPPELPINLDLTELEQLTRRDEVAVAGELVRRARIQLQHDRAAIESADKPPLVAQDQEVEDPRGVILNVSVELIERMLRAIDMRQRIGMEAPAAGPLLELRTRMLADEAWGNVRRDEANLAKERQAVPPSPAIRIFSRITNLVNSLLQLAALDRELAVLTGVDPMVIEEIDRQRETIAAEYEGAIAARDAALNNAQLDQLDALVVRADQVLSEAAALIDLVESATGSDRRQLSDADALARTLEQVDQLMAESERLLSLPGGGLIPVEISMDDAMITALSLRLDLMNERGALADDWRQIKLAADDLKSVLNLNASQTVGTRANSNRPFDFTFDESRTQIGASIDLPINRKSQRNSFRQAMINYQVGRRSLMQREDNIKFAVRNEIRSLNLAIAQYPIEVANAALASQRVLSTQLQLSLGIPGVAARDFLEAQDRYTQALSSVAGVHNSYLVNRAQLFFDLELMQVDENGFWAHLYDEHYQPTPVYGIPCEAGPAYGTLPPGVKYSQRVRRMLEVPPGATIVPTPPYEPSREEGSPGGYGAPYEVEPPTETLPDIGEGPERVPPNAIPPPELPPLPPPGN